MRSSLMHTARLHCLTPLLQVRCGITFKFLLYDRLNGQDFRLCHFPEFVLAPLLPDRTFHLLQPPDTSCATDKGYPSTWRKKHKQDMVGMPTRSRVRVLMWEAGVPEQRTNLTWSSPEFLSWVKENYFRQYENALPCGAAHYCRKKSREVLAALTAGEANYGT